MATPMAAREDVGPQKREVSGRGAGLAAGRGPGLGLAPAPASLGSARGSLSLNSLVRFCDQGPGPTESTDQVVVFWSPTREGPSPAPRGVGAGPWLPKPRRPEPGPGLDFSFASAPRLGGKPSSHFAPTMLLNCPLDLFQSEEKQQRLPFLCCSCSFNSITL